MGEGYSMKIVDYESCIYLKILRFVFFFFPFFMRATEVYILFMARLDREVTSAKEIYSSKNLKNKNKKKGHETKFV